MIKDYFLNYNEALSNDFVLAGWPCRALRRDIDDWRITFVDTGLQSNVGERLRRVRPHLEGDKMFLAHYGDTLTDAPLAALVGELEQRRMRRELPLRASEQLHLPYGRQRSADQRVRSIQDINRSDIWINGGYFVLRDEIFDYMQPGRSSSWSRSSG